MRRNSWWRARKDRKGMEGSRRALVLVAALAMMLGAAPAVLAQGANQTHQWPARPDSSAVGPNVAGQHKVGYGARFHLTYSIVGGVCPDLYALYANQCASGNCECLYFAGHGAGNRIGKAPNGNVLGEMTLDLENNPGDPDGVCFPTFGVLEIQGSKDLEYLDFTGASCQGFDAGLTKFLGGWGFDQSSTTAFDGVGQVTGNFNEAKGTLNLSFHGNVLAN